MNRPSLRTCTALALLALAAACAGEPGAPAARVTQATAAAAPPGALRGAGTATLDGVLSPGEWDLAAVVDLQARVPANDGGGLVPLRLLFMDDGLDLYVAVQVARAFGAGTVNPVYEFDGDLDGVLGPGDDGFGGSEARWSPTEFGDTSRTLCPAGAPGLCGPSDTDTLGGLLPAGTVDGAIAAAGDATTTVLELRHPLRSGDARDFSLSAGGAVGVMFTLRLFSDDSACNFGETCYADTPWPATGSAALAITGGGAPPPPPPGDDDGDCRHRHRHGQGHERHGGGRGVGHLGDGGCDDGGEEHGKGHGDREPPETPTSTERLESPRP